MATIDFCIGRNDLHQYVSEIKGIRYLKDVKEYNISAYVLDPKGKEIPTAPGENKSERKEISNFKLYVVVTNHLGNTFIQFPKYEVKIEHKDSNEDTYKTFYTYLISDKKGSDRILTLDLGIYRKPRAGANKKLENAYEIYIKSQNLEAAVNGH